MSKKHEPVPLPSEQRTFRSSATEVFRWVRAGTAQTKAVPSHLQRLAQDLTKAWEDSAQR